MLKHKDLEQGFSLKNDFSRRHLCQNPPALAGGRLNRKVVNQNKSLKSSEKQASAGKMSAKQ